MKDKPTPPRASRMGRPLSFDRDLALQQAMLTFWRHGYEAASLSDLTKAMGITPPSLYAAFGDKKRLFLEAVARYAGTEAQREQAILGAASGLAAATQLFEHSITLFTGDDTPRGCLVGGASAAGSEAAADVRAALTRIRDEGRAALCRRIGQDVRDGALPPEVDAQALADLVFAVIQGLSTLARDGVPRAQLRALANQVLAAWPGKNGAPLL